MRSRVRTRTHGSVGRPGAFFPSDPIALWMFCVRYGHDMRPSHRSHAEHGNEERIKPMILTEKQKDELKKELVSCLSSDDDVKKIVVFGSFVKSNDPLDLDVAVFQESNETYLPLALKYRKKTRAIAKKIPLDIFPVRSDAKDHTFLSEIDRGEVLYER